MRILPVAPLAWSLAAAAVLAGTPAPARAGQLSGTARLAEGSPWPPAAADGEFEALLLDIAPADAPARVLGRARLAPAGRPPFSFTIPFREADLSPRGRYTVRATLRHRGRLLFTTDTLQPVLTGRPEPLQLVMVTVGQGSGAGRPGTSPLGSLPASWRGDLPGAGGPVRWQVDLFPGGTFQVRSTYLGRPAPNRFDDLGRWWLERASGRLVLLGGREAPLFFSPLAGGAALRKLDLQGRPIASAHNDRLERLAQPQPIEPQLPLLGLFRYLADAASLQLCLTGQRLPVAMEADFPALERAYARLRPGERAGQPLLVRLNGLIAPRPSMEANEPARPTVVVEKFLSGWPGQACPAS